MHPAKEFLAMVTEATLRKKQPIVDVVRSLPAEGYYRRRHQPQQQQPGLRAASPVTSSSASPPRCMMTSTTGTSAASTIYPTDFSSVVAAASDTPCPLLAPTAAAAAAAVKPGTQHSAKVALTSHFLYSKWSKNFDGITRGRNPLPPKIAPSPSGSGSPLNVRFLGPEFAAQMTSRSVHPFCEAHCCVQTDGRTTLHL